MPGYADGCRVGWDDAAAAITMATERARGHGPPNVIVIETYPGVLVDKVCEELSKRLDVSLLLRAEDAYLPEEHIDAMLEPYVGGDDPVFGRLCPFEVAEFLDPARTERCRERVEEAADGLVLVVGTGASLIADPGVLVYADMARWEIQQRQRRGLVDNLGTSNRGTSAKLQYKRAFFIDWRAVDRLKRRLIERWDLVLDTNRMDRPVLATGDAVRAGLREAARRPFSVVPFFDPGAWGGQWMRATFGLDPEPPNFAWCFNCVPEENSLLLGFGDQTMELPSIDLVFYQPEELLGPAVYGRFGAEFPIRFDFLDTMGGGNLSFQVHPTTDYIQDQFGMHYTQDESYYVLEAAPGAVVFLGLKEGIDPQAMIRDLEAAQQGGEPFDAEAYANTWPAAKHDHFMIPAGTVHCQGTDSVVLEISATPYIFTFKLWDWGRVDLDGQPRPIHLNHGKEVIRWNRTTDWVRRELVDRVEELAEGPGWREERTGLHELEFIETRRHWFRDAVPHDTRGTVHVLNLVDGDEVAVESPDGAFEPFVVHYAETFIVPASVGRYTVRPHGPSEGRECATVKAYVRGASLPAGSEP